MTTKSSSPEQPSSAPESNSVSTESSETMRERFMKKISGDPRFILAKPSGKAFVIGGAKT
jgi:hypothetical protein